MMYLVTLIGFSENTHRVANSYEIFNDYFELPIHQEAEIIVKYRHTVEAVRAVQSVVIDNQYPVNYITEVWGLLAQSVLKSAHLSLFSSISANWGIHLMYISMRKYNYGYVCVYAAIGLHHPGSVSFMN